MQGTPPDAPKGLTSEARAIWQQLAPLAFTLGALYAETVPGFVLLCETSVRVAKLWRRLEKDGWTIGSKDGSMKRHPLWTPYAQEKLRLEQLYARYRLAADGRPADVAGAGAKPDAPQNPWQRVAR